MATRLRPGRWRRWIPAVVVLAPCLPPGSQARAQEPTHPPAEDSQEPLVEDGLAAGESSSEPPRRRFTKWNEYEGPYFSIRASAGVILDAATFIQDETSEEQRDLEPGWEVRDFRIMFNGRIKTPRDITWCAGFMYNGTEDEWFVRQTGLMIGVPELKGHVFVGRSKEGISMSMIMVGYSGWTMERSPMVVATVPLLADGIKWMGWLPEQRIVYNVGWFIDTLSEGQSFSSYDQQVVARLGWLPILDSPEAGDLLHVALAGRYGIVNDRTLALRSRPEINLAPNFVDTGSFAAYDSGTLQGEVYYRPGSWLFGAEYFVQWVDALDVSDLTFHGGDVLASWLITGDTRRYKTAGGYFLGVSPDRPVLEHGPGGWKAGPGAWEAVLKFSYADLDDGAIDGGRYWRFTPHLNWHLTDYLRLEIAYGIGQLDQFGQRGTTQFFQTRMQFQF
jgi:phosphate-selective porin OprO/OprP